MDEDEAARHEDMGQVQDEIALLRKMLQHRPAELRQVLRLSQPHPQLRPHLGDEPALLPEAEHRQKILVRPRAALQKHPVDVVAVAAQGVHRVGLGQFDDVPQGVEALLPFFQEVAHQHQNVVPAEAHLGQQALEEEQVAVDIADGQHTAAGGDVRADDDGMAAGALFKHGAGTPLRIGKFYNSIAQP